MNEDRETQIVDLVREWQNNQFEGTIIFSSAQLLQAWEERLLNSLGYLGGIHLALFAGIIESVTQARAEGRHAERSDQLLITWGIIRNNLDQYPLFASENPWYLTGLAKNMFSAIRELKQAGVNEKEVMKTVGFHEDIISLMEEYQLSLDQLKISDPEDALNEFNQIIKQGNGPEHLKRVITLGFHEFTSGQQRTIRLLESQGTVTHFTSESCENVKIADLVANLRMNGLKFWGLTGTDREWEIRGIARTILQAIECGEKPENIAVITRNFAQYRSYIKSIFAEYRIPWNDRSFIAWNNLPSFTSLCLWLRLFCGSVGHNDIRHLFSQFFTGSQGLLLDQWLTEDFSVSGREKSLEKWSQWLREHASKSIEPLRGKIDFLADLLLNKIENLPLEKYWEMGLEWLNITREIEWESGKPSLVRDEESILVTRGHQELNQAWDRWMLWTKSLGWNDMQINPETFLSLIEFLCADQETSFSTLPHEGVLVTTPSEIRNSEFPILFLAGMTEGEFPRAPRRSHIIMDENMERLRSIGYSLKTNDEYSTGERLAFFQTLKAARQSIYLSCPVMETDGKKLSPSPFLMEVRGFLKEEANSWPHYTPSQRLSLDSVSPLEHSLKELSNRSSQCYGLSLETIASIQAEAKRRAGDPKFIGYPGAVDEVSKQISNKFNNHYPFSTSAMKEYAHCPFSFFCKRVLHVDLIDIPGPLPTPAELGSLYHEIFRKFFANHQKEQLIMEKIEQYSDEMQRLVNEFFTEEPELSKDEEDLFALRHLQIDIVKENIRYFLMDELRWQEKIQWRYLPNSFEFSFGGADDEIPLIILDGNEEIRLVGKIDRIDFKSDFQSFIIFDYKTGNVPSHSNIVKGLDLQMPIYIMAAEKLFYPAKAMAASYCSLKKHERTSGLWRKSWTKAFGFSLQNAKEDQEWSSLLDNSKKYLIEYVRSIRKGDFHLTSGECAPYCAYNAVCRRTFTGGLDDEIE